MFLASMSEMYENIVNGLGLFFEQVGDLNWTNIWNWIKGLTVSGSMIGGLAVLIKTVVPMLKNSNKILFNKLGELGLQTSNLLTKVDELQLENKTLREGMLGVVDYLETSANINISSRTLTQAEKDKFVQVATVLKQVKVPLVESFVAKVEQAVADNVITKEEAIDIADDIPQVEQALGTKISDIKLR